MSDPKKKVLVVDDHQTVVRLMEAVLKLRGFAVLHAENGPEALEVVRRERPGMVFLDIMMPGMDGFEVCRQLKADPATRDIPVVFLTARGEEADVARGAEAGAVDFIKKPFQTSDVMRLLEQHLP